LAREDGLKDDKDQSLINTDFNSV
ncbi:hypothetical protein PMI33_02638, partial [Pseudomonas sp. GM67]